MSHKETVLEIYPEAICERAEPGFAIKLIKRDKKYFVKGPTAPLAWKFAKIKLERERTSI